MQSRRCVTLLIARRASFARRRRNPWARDACDQLDEAFVTCVSRISLHAVPFDDSDARTLLTELYADQLTHYDRADPPDEDPSDYTPPRGFFLLLYLEDQPAGCGGYRAHNATTGEIKRLYVRPEHRGRDHGRRILTALEDHSHTVSATSLLLETGARNEAAISLFSSAGYTPVPGYVPNRDQRINRAFTKSLSVPQRL